MSLSLVSRRESWRRRKRENCLWSRQLPLSVLDERRKENWEKGLSPLTSPCTTSISTSQTKKEGGEREKCGVIELVEGV